MTDTAIPIPDDAQAIIDEHDRQVRAACDQFTRALAGTVRDAELGMQAISRAFTDHQET